jgi:hypothetical protein
MRAVPTDESDRPALRCGGDLVLKEIQLFRRSMTVRYAAMQVVVWLLFYAALKLT